MTKDELLAVKRHTRIKYVGADPECLRLIKLHGPKNYESKGLVVDFTTDYSAYNYNRDRGIVLRLWNGLYFEKVKPEEWVVVDATRTDLARSRVKRQVKNTDHWVRKELAQFTQHFRNLKSSKEKIDRWLDDIPLTARLKILTTLTEEEKAWLQLISMDPEEIISSLKKIVTEDEEVNVPVENETQPTRS